MPLGRYAILGDDGDPVGSEVFRCAPGPMGWRYVSEIGSSLPGLARVTVDVAVDADWGVARARVESDLHRVQLEPHGDVLRGSRDGEPIEAPWGPEMHLDVFTPVANLISCRRLDGTGRSIEVVYLEPETLEPRVVSQAYGPLGPDRVDTPVGRFGADRWRFTWDDFHADIWVAGELVVAYEGLFELVHYDPGATGPKPG